MKWTNDLVLEFSRSVTSEVYGIYKGIPTLEGKLKHFIHIKTHKPIKTRKRTKDGVTHVDSTGRTWHIKKENVGNYKYYWADSVDGKHSCKDILYRDILKTIEKKFCSSNK